MNRHLWLVSLALVALLQSSASAYIVLKLNNGEPLRWPSGDVSWTMASDGMPGMDFQEFQGAIDDAFQTWEGVDCATVTFAYDGVKSFDPNTGIHVRVNTSSWDPTVGDALAYALPKDVTWQGALKDVEIVFNAVDTQWSTTSTTAYGFSDVQGVVTHEIGHAIGLDHPRHPEATMFFSGGDVDLRTLDDDDEDGACFLYPVDGVFTQAKACDACESSDNCADGYCLEWGSGETYCGQTCVSDSDCPPDFGCQGINAQIPSQCIPNNQYCHQAGANIPNGEFCYGHETCEGGLCLVLPNEVYCSQPCTNVCPAGLACVGGACMKAGETPYGGECEVSSDCASGVCVFLAYSYGTCTQYCGQNGGLCPGGHQCLQDAVCVPPGDGLIGQPCYTGVQCQTT